MENKIRVAILEDHPLLIEGYQSRLRDSPTIELIGAVCFADDLDDLLATNQVDVLILDVAVPVSRLNKCPYPILLVIPTLLRKYPEMEVLIVSMHDFPTLIRSIMEAGASGYVLKDDAYFLNALPEIIQMIAQSGIYLSPAARERYFNGKNIDLQITNRQLQALSLCAAHPGASTADLANKMKLAASTFRNLLSGAYLHLKVHSRVAAVAKAQQLGFLTPAKPEYDHYELKETP